MKTTVFIGVLLCFHGATALYCYVSEIEQDPITGLLKKTVKERNCEHSKNLPPLDIDLPENGVSCFTLVGTNAYNLETSVKGCIPNGICKSQDLWRVKDSIGIVAADTYCYECSSDFCNFGTKVGSSGLLLLASICVLNVLFVLFA